MSSISGISGSASFSLTLCQLEGVIRAAGASLSRVELLLVLGRLGVNMDADNAASRPPSTPGPALVNPGARPPVPAVNAPAHCRRPSAHPSVPSPAATRASQPLAVDRPTHQAIVSPGGCSTQEGDIEGLVESFNSSCLVQPRPPASERPSETVRPKVSYFTMPLTLFV